MRSDVGLGLDDPSGAANAVVGADMHEHLAEQVAGNGEGAAGIEGAIQAHPGQHKPGQEVCNAGTMLQVCLQKAWWRVTFVT